MKTLFTYIILAILFVGVANAQNSWPTTNVVYPLKAMRATDDPSINRTFIPLKWSGTRSDSSWRINDTSSVLNIGSMKSGDSTIRYWLSVGLPPKDGMGAMTSTMYKIAVYLQGGNSWSGVWRPAVLIDSVGQYGTKQRYGLPATGTAWTADSALASQSLWGLIQGANGIRLAAKTSSLVGCDQFRLIATKDTANTANVWGLNYMFGFIIRGGN